MSRHVTTMTLDDAEHYTPAKRAEIIASYPAHEREARAKGIPTFGSGLVFPIVDDDIAVEAFKLPPHFARINGIDFGYDHPFGAASLGWDRDADILYVVACYAERHQTPIVHVPAIRPWGDWIPCAWPHDGHQHDKGKSGPELAAQYAQHGLEMLPEHATHESGGNGVEAGVTEMFDRMKTGRFKVFKHLAEWFSEKRLYGARAANVGANSVLAGGVYGAGEGQGVKDTFAQAGTGAVVGGVSGALGGAAVGNVLEGARKAGGLWASRNPQTTRQLAELVAKHP